VSNYRVTVVVLQFSVLLDELVSRDLKPRKRVLPPPLVTHDVQTFWNINVISCCLCAFANVAPRTAVRVREVTQLHIATVNGPNVYAIYFTYSKKKLSTQACTQPVGFQVAVRSVSADEHYSGDQFARRCRIELWWRWFLDFLLSW
jgi:hypothetical protein